MTQALLPRSKPWSQFPHDPGLGQQSKQCLDYILTQINQLVFQGNVPPAQSAYAFGPSIIDPTGAQLISLGGRPSSVVTAITYNAVGTQITFYWDGTNGSDRLTIYRDDNTIAGPTIVGSPFLVTGLSAATKYFFYPYWDDINKLVRFVTIPNVSVGTPPVAFAAYNIKAQQIQLLREHITLAAIVGTAGIITGSGAGSAGGSGGGGGSGVAPGRGPTSSSPGGVNGDIQFNNAGVFGGEAFAPLAHGGTGVDLSASGGATFVLAQDAGHIISARALVNADIPNLDASKITTGLLALGRGGTGVDLSAAGSATAFLAESAAHVISARSIIAADVPNLPASIITSGLLALARGGTNADLSATGGASQVLKQVGVGSAVTVAQLAAADISGLAASATTDTTNASNISSGTLPAGRLPNPSAATLGGVESLAAVASNWINQISTAGVPSATQPAFTDISGALAGAQNTDLGASAGTAYFVPITISYPQTTSAAAVSTVSQNCIAVMFNLPFRITVRKVSINVTTGVAASTITVGIYTPNGLTKLIDSGTFNSATTGVKTNTLGAAVTLSPGAYYFVQSSSATTTATTNLGPDNTRTLLLNANVNRTGIPANPAVAGVLPATLGAIGSLGTGFGITLGFFES